MRVKKSISKKDSGIVCKHCKSRIQDATILEGFSVICPFCRKPL